MNFLRKNLLSHWAKLTPNVCAAITLVWQANVERDLAGYKVYIGEKPKQYTSVVNVGKRTRYSLDNLPRNKTLYLAVTAYDVSGNESPQSVEVVLPSTSGGGTASSSEGTLERVYNFPNPFRAGGQTTTLRYFLAEAARVSLRVYNVKGDLIKTLGDKVPRASGENLMDTWDATDQNGTPVSPGLYYVEIQAQDQRTIVKVVVQP